METVKKKIVLVGGCFDILHIGHTNFLKEAKKLGDYLVVALESDENTKKLKGPGRPIHTQKQRKEILESLRFVDKVIPLPEMKTDEDYSNLIKKVRPFVIAVTQGDPVIEKKKMHANLVGAKVVKINKMNVYSTTQIAKLFGME